MPFMNLITSLITRRVKRKMECIKVPDIEGLIKDYERLVEEENNTGKEGSVEWRTQGTGGKDTASVS